MLLTLLLQAQAAPPLPATCQPNYFDCITTLQESGRIQSEESALPLFSRLCKTGDPLACVYTGYMHATGIGTPQDTEIAAELYQKACNQGEDSGCYDLCFLYIEDRGISKAIPYFLASCKAGDTDHCYDLGFLYHHGYGVFQDPEKASKLYEKACDENHAAACYALGNLSAQTEPDNREKASTYYQKACDNKLGKGCNQVDPAKVTEETARSYRDYCQSGELESCVVLGTFYLEGTGVPKDKARAAFIFEQTCEAGVATGCTELGKVYATSNHKDYVYAIEFFSTACTLGDAAGCTELGNLYATGRGIPWNDERAEELYTQACLMGDTVACRK